MRRSNRVSHGLRTGRTHRFGHGHRLIQRNDSDTLGLETLESRHLLTGSIGLTIDEIEVSEDVGHIVVTLLRTGDLEGRATIDYTTVEDSARADADFTTRRGTFTFKPGISGQQIEIPIRNDSVIEPIEALRFELSNPTGGAELGRSTQRIRILDNDDNSVPPFRDDFESFNRWTTDPDGTDTATTGRWEVGAPQGTTWNDLAIQPAAVAEGQRALITGLSTAATALSNDVDGGSTSILSPSIEIPDDELLDLTFDYFVSHDDGATEEDFFRVSVIYDEKIPLEDASATEPQIAFLRTADVLLDITGESTFREATWSTFSMDFTPYAGKSIRFLIEANDGGDESILEAGVDRFLLEVLPDAPGIFTVDSATINVEEGPDAHAEVKITRSRGRVGDVSVRVSTANDGATADVDYWPRIQTIQFPDGVTSQILRVPILDDDEQESLEHLTLTLSEPSDGATLGDSVTARIRIIDDDRFDRGMLPDVMPIAGEGERYIDTSERLGRAVYRFGTTVANNGDGPLEIWGGEASGSTQEVLQRIYDTDGTSYDRLAGSFVYHPEHGHVHLEGFATFNLRSVGEDGEPGELVASGGKTSFCLINIAHPFPETTDAVSQPHGRGGESCDTIQGISVGHADVYDASLAGQWIDVTDLPDGEYFLEVHADPDDHLLEIDETNNLMHELVTIDNPYYENGDFIEIEAPPADDQANGPGEDALVLTSNSRVSASIENEGDRDWFRFEAAEGTAYEVEIILNSLGDSELELADADGEVITSDDDGGSGLGSQLTWVAPRSGTFYWVAKGLGSSTGSYNLRYEVLADDHGSASTGATNLTTNEYLNGEIEIAGDRDWFRFEANGEQHYQIDARVRLLRDSAITLYGGDGITKLLENNDLNSEGSSQIIFQPKRDGVFFVLVKAGDDAGANTGSYRVRVQEIDPPTDEVSNEIANATPFAINSRIVGNINYPLDTDVYSFQPKANTEYLIRATTNVDDAIEIPELRISNEVGWVMHSEVGREDGSGASFVWTADSNDPVYVHVSGNDGMTGAFAMDVAIEHADSTTDAVAIEQPFEVRTTFHTADDVDVFAFRADSGWAYSIHTSDLGGIDTRIKLIDTDGETELLANDDESAVSVASRLNWVSNSAGIYYVVVEPIDERLGDYKLTIEAGSRSPIVQAAADDLPNSLSEETNQSIRRYERLEGRIDYAADEDWFKFSAISTRPHNVRLHLIDESHNRSQDEPGEVAGSESQTALDTRLLPAIRVYDENHALVQESHVTGTNKTTTLNLMVSGRHFIQVTNPSKGLYELELDSDDHGDNPVDARVASTGTRISGNLERIEDSDWFRINPELGIIYDIRTHLVSSGLNDSTLRIYDENGLEQDYNDDGDDGLSSRLSWSPADESPFYFEVDGLSEGTGTYEVEVTEIPDDHGDTTQNATAIDVNSKVAGRVQLSSDVDWFVIEVTAGNLYRASTSMGYVSIIKSDGRVLETSSSGLSSTASFLAPSDGQMFVQVQPTAGQPFNYELTVESLVDQHSDSADGATLITIGKSTVIQGDIEVPSDLDWFQFQPKAGKTYRIDASNDRFGFATLKLHDSEGREIPQSSGQGFFWAAPVSVSPDAPYFISASGWPGPFDIQISELDPTPLFIPTDVSASVEVSGSVSDDSRANWYSVSPTPGNIYSVELLEGSENQLRTRVFLGNSLISSRIANSSLLAIDDTPIRIEVSGKTNGNFRVAVSEVKPTLLQSPHEGSYTITQSGESQWFRFQTRPGVVYEIGSTRSLTPKGWLGLEEITLSDDRKLRWLSNEVQDVTVQISSLTANKNFALEVSETIPELIADGETARGTLGEDEVDWYQFEAVLGLTYQIETSLTTLGDSVLELFNPSGDSLSQDDDSGEGVASRIEWAAEETGPLFFQVRGYLGDSGRYRVTLTQEGEPVVPKIPSAVDLNDDGKLTATDIDALFAAARDTESSNERFDFNSDSDINDEDIELYLSAEYANVIRGDIDLDGDVTFADFLVFSSSFGDAGLWGEGDFTGDGWVNFDDFLYLSRNFA